MGVNVPCATQQNVYATVTAGTLSQQAVVTNGNPNSKEIVLCRTVLGGVFDIAGTQPGNNANC